MANGRGFQINFSVPELSEAINKIGSYDGKTALKIENQVQTSGKNIRGGAVRRVRVRTGYLKKHISTRFDKKTITSFISAKAPHAHLVEFGAKAAVTKPDTKKALKIPWRGMGVEGMYFAKSAQIPQRKAYPYMRPAFEAEKPNLIRGLKEAVKP